MSFRVPRSGSRSHVAVERRAGDAQRAADIVDRIGRVGVELLEHGQLLGIERLGSASDAATRASGAETGQGAFADQIAFKLRQRAEDMKDQLSAGGRGVDLLGERLKTDPTLVERADGFEKMGEGTAQPIQAPDDEHVTGPELLQGLVQTGSLGLGAADGIGERAFTPCLLESVTLEIEGLLLGGDAGVADQHGLEDRQLTGGLLLLAREMDAQHGLVEHTG